MTKTGIFILKGDLLVWGIIIIVTDWEIFLNICLKLFLGNFYPKILKIFMKLNANI